MGGGGSPRTDVPACAGKCGRNAVKNIIRNSEGRLRSGWRVLLQLVGFFILVIVVQSLQGMARERQSALLYGTGSGIYLLGAVCILWGFARWIDRRRYGDFGLHLNREWWLDLGVGLGLGAFTLTAVVAIEWTMGWATFRFDPATIFDGPFVLIAIAALLDYVAIGVAEETTFRAYQVRNIAEGIKSVLGGKWAVVITLLATSLLFGMAHMSNPNATLMSGLNVTLAGMLLGLGFVLTGELALSVGLHTAWILFEEFVYGFATSGRQPHSWLIKSEAVGPDIWTGGLFGPEAGLLIVMLVIVDALLISFWIRVRHRWVGVRGELANYAIGSQEVQRYE